jgi:hypothetical protein
MALRRRLALVLAVALLLPACGGDVTTPSGQRAVIAVTVDPNPVPASQSPLTGAVSVGYKIVITETNGGSGEVLFVSSQIYDPETGAQVSLTYFDSSDLVVFVGSKKIEPFGTLTVPQTASYILLPDYRTAAQMTVNVQVQGEQGALINQSVLVKIE